MNIIGNVAQLSWSERRRLRIDKPVEFVGRVATRCNALLVCLEDRVEQNLQHQPECDPLTLPHTALAVRSAQFEMQRLACIAGPALAYEVEQFVHAHPRVEDL